MPCIASGTIAGSCWRPGGDYLVIVKKNQRELYDAIALAFVKPVWGKKVPAGPAAEPAWGPLGNAATAGHGGPERISEGMPGLARGAAGLPSAAAVEQKGQTP